MWEKKVGFFTSLRKPSFWQPHSRSNPKKPSKLDVEIYFVQADKDKAGLKKLVDCIKSGAKNNKVGHLAKDKFISELTESFMSSLQEEKFQLVDISYSISEILATKDETELILLKKACDITCNLFTKHLKEQIMDVIDSDRVSNGFLLCTK